jgi:hypothetical protein
VGSGGGARTGMDADLVCRIKQLLP